MSKKYDILVIGAGPGGYVAAIRAAQLGYKTCVIEREALGGVCLNWGCIPTKALLRSAEVHYLIKNSEKYGIKIDGTVKIDFKKVIERSRAVSQQLSNGIKILMKKNKIEVINGTAKLLGNKKVDVSGDIIEGTHIILATGARPRELPNIVIDNKLIWNYKDAMIADNIPQKLLIIGAGAIGVEYASFYNEMGSDVTITEVAPRILLTEDEEISGFAHKSFEKSGIKIMTKSQITAVVKKSENVEVTITDADGKKHQMTFDRVISAAGVVPNTENLGFENTKIELEKSGHIITNEWMETNEQGIYAIGDITKPPFLAHKASHEAIVCVEKIANLPFIHPIEKNNIPGCVYSYPQVASIGLTEEKAKEKYDINVGRFPFVGNGKAIALGEENGLMKMISDKKTGEILGVHMVGAEVTELIHGFAIAKTGELTINEIIQTIFPHPTLSEMSHEATLALLGRAIHI